MPSYDSLLDALNGLKNRGFIIDFNLAFDKIKCDEKGLFLSPSDFNIIENYRFEGMSNPDDSSVVYAIESKDGKLKGVLVNAFSIYSDNISDEMIKKLSIAHRKIPKN